MGRVLALGLGVAAAVAVAQARGAGAGGAVEGAHGGDADGDDGGGGLDGGPDCGVDFVVWGGMKDQMGNCRRDACGNRELTGDVHSLVGQFDQGDQAHSAEEEREEAEQEHGRCPDFDLAREIQAEHFSYRDHNDQNIRDQVGDLDSIVELGEAEAFSASLGESPKLGDGLADQAGSNDDADAPQDYDDADGIDLPLEAFRV